MHWPPAAGGTRRLAWEGAQLQRMPRSIALISRPYPLRNDGIAHYGAALARALAPMCHVQVITGVEASGDASTGPLQIERILRGWGWRESVRIVRAIVRARAEAIILQTRFYDEGEVRSLFTPALPLLLRLITGRPVISIIHELEGRCGMQAAWSSSTVVVEREHLEALSGYTPHIRYVPIASSIPRVPLSGDERTALRARFGVPPGSTVLCFFGHIYPRKGFELLLDAARQLREERQITLLIVGTWDGQQGAPGELAWIRTTGYLPAEEVARAIGCADICVLPFLTGSSWRYTSLLAALMQDVHVVTTDGLNAPMSGVTYVPVGDLTALTGAIRRASEAPFAGTRTLPTWEHVAGGIMEVAAAATARERRPLLRGGIGVIAHSARRKLEAASVWPWKGA